MNPVFSNARAPKAVPDWQILVRLSPEAQICDRGPSSAWAYRVQQLLAMPQVIVEPACGRPPMSGRGFVVQGRESVMSGATPRLSDARLAAVRKLPGTRAVPGVVG